MTEAKRERGVVFITPRGPLIYPKLQKPDTKFKKEGQYTAKIRIDGLSDELMEKITAERDRLLELTIAGIKAKTIGPKWNTKERAEKLKDLKTPDVLQLELDKEGEETGKFLINAKMTASGVSKRDGKPWSREPKVFDSKGKKLFPIPAIFGGTEVKLSVEAKAFFAPGTKDAPPVVGITYYLEAVQVLKLVKGGDRDAGSFGFGEEEGGYEGDESEGEAAGFGDESGGEPASESSAPTKGDEF